ncbi:Protein of unknown function [Gryllus bimaculatus]|nr:Protein of unknown function [Gryllus bimaculatus]
MCCSKKKLDFNCSHSLTTCRQDFQDVRVRAACLALRMCWWPPCPPDLPTVTQSTHSGGNGM